MTERTVGVVGLGYVGLPLAVTFAEAGFRVVGVDVDAGKVATLRAGGCYVADVPTAQVAALVEAGRLLPTTEYGALAGAEGVSICVPTPLGKAKDPDVSYVAAAAERLAPVLRRGQVVVLESTVYPGATEELVAPLLERGSGLRAGEDFALAFSPERINPGDRRWRARDIPKLVGGVNAASTERAAALYREVFATVVPLASAREAELAKLLENTFRAVNIGLVNELAVLAHRLGVDIWRVIDAAATKPFGFMPFYPGPGWGGHCIPVDPFYLSWRARVDGAEAGFIEHAGRVNDRMPAWVVERVADLLNRRGRSLQGSRLLLLGVAYKGDVGDVRESPALPILALLVRKGARVAYHDPHVPEVRHLEWTWRSLPLTPETLAAQDCVVVVTDHSGVDYGLVVEHAPLVFDARNATRHVRGRARGEVVLL